jgi:hypothetical protein
MFFKLKKKIISKSIEKRIKQHPFDFQYAENFTLKDEADSLMNNSYYFSAHDEKMSVFARLGKRTDMDETWFTVYFDGKIHTLREEFFESGESPLHVEKNGDDWDLSFQGIVNEKDKLLFQAKFRPQRSPIDFTTDMPAERMAVGIANERWNRTFFENLKNISGQCHYEQEGVLEGRMTLNEESLSFSLPCVRDHSFGKRDWNDMNNHLWLMAVSLSCQINYSLVSYPALSVLEVGHCRNGNDMHYMSRADLNLETVNQGTVPSGLKFKMILDDGRVIDVDAKVLTGVTYHFQDGSYILHENVAEFCIDGNVCRGILEIGFNKDHSRYFNQRDLKSIKR